MFIFICSILYLNVKYIFIIRSSSKTFFLLVFPTRICPNLTAEQREAAFLKFDKDKTGKINYKEWCSMMNNAKKKAN